MPKARTNFRSRRPKRDAYNKVLIVCEGQKTEPNYFREIIYKYRINTANIMIDGTSGSSPKSIVEYALGLYRLEKKKGDAFDQVFCVFDKDSHGTYQWAKIFVDKTDRELRNELIDEDTLSEEDDLITIFNATTTVPCFEYWLLLHFIYTTKPYASAGNNSSCMCVINDLKTHIPNYKNLKLMFLIYYSISWKQQRLMLIMPIKQQRDQILIIQQHMFMSLLICYKN